MARQTWSAKIPHACDQCEKTIRLPAAKTREEREADIAYHKGEYGGMCRQCHNIEKALKSSPAKVMILGMAATL